jgi:hypothetical protein
MKFTLSNASGKPLPDIARGESFSKRPEAIEVSRQQYAALHAEDVARWRSRPTENRPASPPLLVPPDEETFSAPFSAVCIEFDTLTDLMAFVLSHTSVIVSANWQPETFEGYPAFDIQIYDGYVE